MNAVSKIREDYWLFNVIMMSSEEEMMDFLKDNDVNFKMFLMLFKVMFATEHIKEIEENQKENTISMEYYNQVLEKTVKLA